MTPREGLDDYPDHHRCLQMSHLPHPEQSRAPPAGGIDDWAGLTCHTIRVVRPGSRGDDRSVGGARPSDRYPMTYRTEGSASK